MKNFYSWALLIIAFAFFGITTNAATITVDNTNDSGAGSLRQAVADAAPGDTIDFSFMLLAFGNDTIKLTSEISVNKNLVIDGYHTSYDTLFISGEGVGRVFNINASGGMVKLDGLTIIDGVAIDGGGVYKSGGSELHVIDCNFYNNTCTDEGGALHRASGYMYVYDSHFAYNAAVTEGGAIYGSPSTLIDIDYSTFNNNLCSGDGGAFYGFVTPINFTNCTFYQNEALGDGGAIYDWGSAVLMSIINCTITENIGSPSGGVELWGSSVEMTIGSTIITGNTGTDQMDVWGAGASTVSLGYNIIGDATMPGSVGTDQIGVAAAAVDWGPFGDNGGTTLTLMPNAGSVAEDMGEPSDLSDAQNGAILDGARDAGSTELYACAVTYSAFHASTCTDYTVPSGDETYTISADSIVTDTLVNSCGEDSIMTIYIIFGDVAGPVPDVSSLPDTTAECEVTLTAPTATDGCTGPVTGTTTTSFPITTPGLTVVTWEYTDGTNITTQTQNVTIVPLDNTVSVSGITLTSNSIGSTYQWVECPGMTPIAGETNQDFTPTANGDYAVIISKGACTDTSACTTISQIGIADQLIENIHIYPNPTRGELNIDFGSLSSPVLRVYTLDGRMIFEDQNIAERIYRFELEQETGVYVIDIQSDQHHFSQKVVLK